MAAKYLSIQEAMDKGSGKVSVRGWVHRERGSNKLKFVSLRDSTNVIQCVLKREDFEKQWEDIDHLQVETSLLINGEIKKDERAPTGYEIRVIEFKVVGKSENYPITKDHSPEFLADNRHLWLRSRRMISILKIRSTVFGAIHEYFRNEGFYEYHSPIFQSVQCEGGSTLFEVPYFGKRKEVFLGQTWQLYAEPAIFALEKIYTISPSFRAEKSKTSRHLTEYWHAEMEVAWADFKEIMDYGEGLIKFVVQKVLEKNKEELKLLERDLKKLEPIVKKPFIRMTYDEALKILKDKCKMPVTWGKDLRTIEEEKLTKLYDVPLIVSHYPKVVKAFYMTEDPKNPDVVQGCDFLAPEGYGEIIGGSHREPELEEIKKRLKEQGEDPKEYEFYLDTRRYGSVPHGGFGLGVERIITWICGLDNIKDSIPFPRTMERYRP
ncbi:MAG: asparagine--tRNA ligase [Nanoarchaeota archaeon]|nr:asparagine--tRNA ligase [Nanoarchaeota archaeon]MBU1644012.1 asparagine--tRNA ligase [Nanoarchaeota archaeon]MBU1976907.1 asparagine--tRNA ligase [Nanoarchaeota archaeon]